MVMSLLTQSIISLSISPATNNYVDSLKLFNTYMAYTVKIKWAGYNWEVWKQLKSAINVSINTFLLIHLANLSKN